MRIDIINDLFSVSWNISKCAEEIGDDVILTCYVDETKTCMSKTWRVGPDQTILIFDGESNDGTKYENRNDGAENQFSILIKNISLADVNVLYMCMCGLYSYEAKLELSCNTCEHKRFQ